MTMSNQTNRTSAIGTGTEQTVPFSFPVVNNSDITVEKRLITTGAATTLAETTDYTVTNNGSAGGSITTITPFIPATYEIHIIRNTPMTQELDLEAGGSFNAENIEAALDKNTRLIVENADTAKRALHAPDTDAVALDMTIPNAVDRASKNLGFDASGNPTVTTASGTFTMANAYYDDIITKSPWYDVRAYGATGDGTTDDSTAIQAAIDAAIADGGGTVFLPSGEYNLGTTGVELKKPDGTFDNIGLRFCSNALIPAKLYYTGTGAAVTIYAKSIEADHLYIDCKSTGSNGITISRMWDSYLHDIDIYNTPNAGINWTTIGGSLWNHLENIKVDASGAYGIKMDATAAAINANCFVNCRFFNTTTAAIYLSSGCILNSFKGGDASYADGIAVDIDGATRTTVDDLYIEGATTAYHIDGTENRVRGGQLNDAVLVFDTFPEEFSAGYQYKAKIKAIGLPNILNNGDFDRWITSSRLRDWTVYGGDITQAREETIKVSGRYSVAVSSATKGFWLFQKIDPKYYPLIRQYGVSLRFWARGDSGNTGTAAVVLASNLTYRTTSIPADDTWYERYLYIAPEALTSLQLQIRPNYDGATGTNTLYVDSMTVSIGRFVGVQQFSYEDLRGVDVFYENKELVYENERLTY